MPDNWTCPRCNTGLREEDFVVWDLPFSPLYERNSKSMLQVSCWCCTWKASWQVDEVTEPTEVKL